MRTRHRHLRLLLVLTLGVAHPLAAQSQQGTPAGVHAEYKDPGTATLLGVMVTGGGQMYAGETSKGIKLLAIGVGSFAAGEVISLSTCSSGDSCSLAPLAAGALVYLGTWAYGLMDAGDAARRHNAAAGIRTASVRLLIEREESRGVRLGFTLGI